MVSLRSVVFAELVQFLMSEMVRDPSAPGFCRWLNALPGFWGVLWMLPEDALSCWCSLGGLAHPMSIGYRISEYVKHPNYN